ncbi:MAG: hypothetical protein BWX65_00536 [Bacteroidetes bacterium ADurb.Bin057]|jgi:hypothetical protein|nr:MAG: hypothetical protein BWX65_00536 [Bacteroidetes bacterium ADurb.Bin057]
MYLFYPIGGLANRMRVINSAGACVRKKDKVHKINNLINFKKQ